MKFKKIYLFCFIFLFVFSTIIYANSEENEQININQIEQEVIEASANSSQIPTLNSRAAIVIDRNSNVVLFSKNETEKRKMASTTKIMTAIVVIENTGLYDTVTVSQKAASTGGSKLGLKVGDKITVCDLLYGLMLKSGNDTAVVLAEHVGGSLEGFAELMNKKARELNLNQTHFVTPHGLDSDEHYTTAYELALLTNYALNNKTFLNLVSAKNYTVTINGSPKEISNTNELLGNLNGIYGVKTGFTNGANRCLVTSCKRDNLDIICVVLGADTKKFRTQDSIKLIEYTFKTYQMIDLESIVLKDFEDWKANSLSKFKINKGIFDNLKPELKDFNYKLYPIKKENIKNINTSIDCDYSLEAPISSGSNIGTMNVNIDKDNILKFNIVSTAQIKKKNTLNYFTQILSEYFDYLAGQSS